MSPTSARREAELAELRASALRERYLQERQRAQNFRVADRTETEVLSRLQAMEAWGWTVLADRRWSRRSRANIDLILIGPGGVIVIDVKCWAEPDIVDGTLYRGQENAQDDVDKLLRVTELVTDALAEFGLAPAEVNPAMVFVGQRGTNTMLGRIHVLDERELVPWAHARGPRLAADKVDQLVTLLADRFPAYDGEPDELVSTVVPEPVLPISRHSEAAPDSLFDVAALTDAILAHARMQSIEDWMTFLHPEQIRLVRRAGPGPARIRGAAGTGKTVVALHRAAYLAETSGPVLFTSFVKTLSPVMRGLYSRMAPATIDQLEFVNLHAWARQLLASRGNAPRIDAYKARAAYTRAWNTHGRGSALAQLGVPWEYWRDEIDYVIKGRGITSFADYASLSRVGRRTALQPVHREIVWTMYAEYEHTLRASGVADFNDLLSLALAEVRERPLQRPYGAVIADEVQDLNCQGVRLLAELSGGGERLLLVGDGQQQIYPGGFTLAEAGLSVAGRSAVLRTNYRNAAEILDVAHRVVADDEFADLEGGTEHGHRDVQPNRQGGRVLRQRATSVEELRALAIEHIRALAASGESPAGMAVLCRTNSEVDAFMTGLARAGIRAMKLADYTGEPADAVKVGTVQRAKGLEFKHVVCAFRAVLRPGAGSAEIQREEIERDNRTLFVAMTRARDSLWHGDVA